LETGCKNGNSVIISEGADHSHHRHNGHWEIRCRILVSHQRACANSFEQLAVEIAKRFNGEIINADAVQMYEGLPVITNKIPEDERKGVVHHLLGSISLHEPPWTVQQFLPKALSIIDEIRSRDRVPILVGGTHYYTQALLFKDHTIEQSRTDESDVLEPSDDFPVLQESTEIILSKLREVDPVMANRWHPNDRRKIQRSLQIYLQTGKPASETYKGRLEKESSANAGLRFPTLMLWPHCEREAHKTRLDRRVDRMLENGLLVEVAQLMSLRATNQASGEDVDYTKGIWQAIGLRQFDPYHQALASGTVDAKELHKLKQAAIEQTQAATRRYANSQLKWIRIKFLNALVRADALQTLFVLDGTELSTWQSSVVAPSLQLTQAFLADENLPDPASLSPLATHLLTPQKEDLTHSPASWGVKTCEVCGTNAATPQLWKQHIASRGHKIRISKMKARETTSLVVVEREQEAEVA
jgi:tRNA dimethylallyltransferase